MHMKIQSFTSIVRLLPALILSLAALTSPVSAREVRTIYLPGSGGPLSKVHLIGAKVHLELELPPRNLSSAVEIPKGDLQLVALSKPPASPEDIPQGAPQILIPESWQRCILIFLGDPGNPVFPARIIPVNAGGVGFPKGTTRVYNLTDATIGGKFGTERILVKPGKTETFDAPMRDFGSYPVAIDCILKDDAAPRALCRSNWQHDPEARQILFVVAQKGQPLPRVWSVLDHAWSPITP